jgi:signal transduction histidine kinase
VVEPGDPDGDQEPALVTSGVWYCRDEDRFPGFHDHFQGLRCRTGEGLPGRVLATARAASVSELTAEPTLSQVRSLADSGLHAALAFPVMANREVTAVLEFLADDLGDPEELLELLSSVGTQLGRVMERTRAAEALREAKDAAETANEGKSAFLARMTHELRTPLNAIIGYSELLAEDLEESGDEQVILDLDRISGAGKHLLSLISDILDLSKIEAGKTELTLAMFDVEPLVQEVAATVRPLVMRNRNTLEVRIGPGVGTMYADPTRLRQVLLNLVNNASKFTADGSIVFTVERETGAAGAWVTFAVSDTGIGIGTVEMAGLFEPFAQANANISRDYGGTGLGLTISRRFCHMMGGSIGVTSEAGVGSTFTVRLPASNPPAASDEPPVGPLPALATRPESRQLLA